MTRFTLTSLLMVALVVPVAVASEADDSVSRSISGYSWDTESGSVEWIIEYTTSETETVTRNFWRSGAHLFIVRDWTDLEEGIFGSQLFDMTSYWWAEAIIDSPIDFGPSAKFEFANAFLKAADSGADYELSFETSDGFLKSETVPHDPASMPRDEKGRYPQERIIDDFSASETLSAIPQTVHKAIGLIRAGMKVRDDSGGGAAVTLLPVLEAGLDLERGQRKNHLAKMPTWMEVKPRRIGAEEADQIIRSFGELPDDLTSAE